MSSCATELSFKHVFLCLVLFCFALGLGFLLHLDIQFGVLFFFILLTSGLVLVYPLTFYLLFLSTLSLEGFAALEHISFTKIFGIIVLLSLALKIFITRENIRLRDPFYIYFYAFVVTGLISSLVAKDMVLSFTTLSTYISLSFLYFITCYFVTNLKIFDGIIFLLILSTLAVTAFVQSMHLSIRNIDTWRVSSGLGDPNEFALFLLVLLPLAFYKILWSSVFAKVFSLLSFSLLLMLLLFTGSRGGMVAFCGMMIIFAHYFTKRYWQYLLLFVGIFVLLLCFFIPADVWNRLLMLNYFDASNEFSSEIRLTFYKAALHMFRDHPFLGLGLHNFKTYALEYGTGKALVSHNTYLEVLSGGGILHFIPFMLILLLSWNRLKIKRYATPQLRDLAVCLKASLVAGLIGATFITADVKKILWILFAFIASVYYINLTISKKQVSNEHL